MIQSQQDTHPKNWNYAVKLKIDSKKINSGIKSFLKIWAQSGQKSIFKIKQSLGK